MDRVEQFIEWFGKSVQIEDCDPALFIINYFFDRFEFNDEQKLWLSWIYGTTYQFPTTYVIWNEFPDMELVGKDRLREWNDLHYHKLRYQVDTKWNKGHLPAQFESYKKWVGDNSQREKIDSLLTGDKFKDFDTMWKEAKSWYKFGRYSAWFYLQTIRHCANVKIEPKTLMLEDYSGSRSHRNGLCYALGAEELIDTKLNANQLDRFDTASAMILDATKDRFPKLHNKIDYFAMETCLCSFKKLFRTQRGRYLGYYLDRQAEEIKQVEKDGWIGINWDPLWQARKESIKKQYLTGSIDKEKMKLYLQEHPLETTKTLTLIGGLPASGKTTLMNRIRKKIGTPIKKQHELLRYEEYPNHIVLGIYNGEVFDGTDKLSMAVMKDALDFLRTNHKPVLIEGDRLFNQKFIEAAINLGYKIKIAICIITDLIELTRRYKRRGRMQPMNFIKGRHTKIQNIIVKYPHTTINTNKPIPDKTIRTLI